MSVAKWLRAHQPFQSVLQRFWPEPPPLPEHYDLADFGQFMRAETFLFEVAYVKRLIKIHNPQIIIESAKQGGAVICMLHYGSWILGGASFVHQLNLPYKVIASRRNIETACEEEAAFWLGVHQRGENLTGQSIIYSDQSPRVSLNWLKSGNFLGAVLDVREQQYRKKEYPFRLAGKDITMQVGPARLANLSGVPMIPTAIQFDPLEKRHHLYIYEPIAPGNDPQVMTQQALKVLEKTLIERPEQQLYEIVEIFSKPDEMQ